MTNRWFSDGEPLLVRPAPTRIPLQLAMLVNDQLPKSGWWLTNDWPK